MDILWLLPLALHLFFCCECLCFSLSYLYCFAEMSRLLFKGKVNSIIFTLPTSLVMSENRQVRKHLRGYITVSFGALDHMKFCKWVHVHVTSITSEGALQWCWENCWNFRSYDGFIVLFVDYRFVSYNSQIYTYIAISWCLFFESLVWIPVSIKT